MNETPVWPEPAPLISGWKALLGVLTDPVRTFERLGDRPAIAPPYLLQMAAGAIGFFLSFPVIMRLAQEQIDKMGAQQPNPLPPEAMQYITLGSGLVGVLVSPWFTGLLVTLVALLFGLFVGGRGTFSGYFGMVGYAQVPLAISMLLSGLWMRMAGSQLDISAAALLAADASPALKGALTALNPLSLWYYGLLAIGFAQLNRKRPAAGAALVITLFLVSMLFAMASGKLAGGFNVSVN